MKGVKRNNAVGVKGRSGRKSYPVELAKIESIKKAWNIVEGHLDSKNDVAVALPIALKDMTEKKSVEGSLTLNVNPEVKEKIDALVDELYKRTTERDGAGEHRTDTERMDKAEDDKE